MMASHKFACMVAVMCIVVVSAPMAHAAITCSQVTSALAPCIVYLLGGGGPVLPGCCNGIKGLNVAAKTTANRQAVCNCLKNAAGSISGLNPSYEASLPGKCGVSIPYKISPSTNCATIR